MEGKTVLQKVLAMDQEREQVLAVPNLGRGLEKERVLAMVLAMVQEKVPERVQEKVVQMEQALAVPKQEVDLETEKVLAMVQEKVPEKDQGRGQAMGRAMDRAMELEMEPHWGMNQFLLQKFPRIHFLHHLREQVVLAFQKGPLAGRVC